MPGVALANPSTKAIIYTPPEGERLLCDLLSNWEQFIHADDDIPPAIKMAVAHYQFEAIHPFNDGNGRTGRILNVLYLMDQGLLDLPILYLSRYIVRNKGDYYRLLWGVTQGQAWEPWIIYMLEGITKTALWTSEKIHAMHKLMKHTTEYIRKVAPRTYSHELLQVIFNQPYCRIQNVIDAGIAKRQTASVHLKQLVDVGVLVETKVGREKLFFHPKLMELLDNDSDEIVPYTLQ